MNTLPHLTTIFDRLRRGYHLGPDDEPEFSRLCERFDEYAAYFAALGITLVRHEREFFYFNAESPETVPDTLPRIAVFSYIMIDHAANQGRPIDEFIFGQNFLVTALPHFTLDRYTAEQTREFYFLKQYSYVLFECLGATGKCVIGWRGQSKTSGGEPERFFHVGPFDRSDFLDGRNQVREAREVSARLALKQFRAIKSAQEHRELLLPAANGDGRGLGVVALHDIDKYHHFRETLKTLLALSAISQEQMRDRLLMLA